MSVNLKKLILILAPLMVACNGSNEGVKPKRKPLIEAVYASGFIVAKDEYEVISQAEGYIDEKLVADGDLVKRGDALYIIQSEQQSARNRIARETYALAEQNFRDDSPVLKELKAAVETSKTKLRFDSSNFVRYTNLLNSNATSKAEYDRIRLLFENSKNEYTLQKSRYDRTRNQLQLELQNARNNLVIASDEAGRYIVRSDVDGRVFMTSKDKGELIRRGEVVAVVGKKDQYFVQLNIDELDVQRIKEGQKAIVKIDAYPNEIFQARVSKIYPMVDRKQQSVRIDADLSSPLPGWFSGLALEANIIINEKAQALVIPKSSLLPGDSVLIETDDDKQKVKVKKGIETLDEVEIIEGLDTGSLLVINRN